MTEQEALAQAQALFDASLTIINAAQALESQLTFIEHMLGELKQQRPRLADAKAKAAQTRALVLPIIETARMEATRKRHAQEAAEAKEAGMRMRGQF